MSKKQLTAKEMDSGLLNQNFNEAIKILAEAMLRFLKKPSNNSSHAQNHTDISI